MKRTKQLICIQRDKCRKSSSAGAISDQSNNEADEDDDDGVMQSPLNYFVLDGRARHIGQ